MRHPDTQRRGFRRLLLRAGWSPVPCAASATPQASHLASPQRSASPPIKAPPVVRRAPWLMFPPAPSQSLEPSASVRVVSAAFCTHVGLVGPSIQHRGLPGLRAGQPPDDQPGVRTRDDQGGRLQCGTSHGLLSRPRHSRLDPPAVPGAEHADLQPAHASLPPLHARSGCGRPSDAGPQGTIVTLPPPPSEAAVTRLPEVRRGRIPFREANRRLPSSGHGRGCRGRCGKRPSKRTRGSHGEWRRQWHRRWRGECHHRQGTRERTKEGGDSQPRRGSLRVPSVPQAGLESAARKASLDSAPPLEPPLPKATSCTRTSGSG